MRQKNTILTRLRSYPWKSQTCSCSHVSMVCVALPKSMAMFSIREGMIDFNKSCEEARILERDLMKIFGCTIHA
jgi:hypothetical protein